MRMSQWFPIAALSTFVAIAGCTVDDGTNPDAHPQDSGVKRDTKPPEVSDAGSLQPFNPPPSDPGVRAILFSASGEALALGGYAFPPASKGDPVFVDGWQIEFTRLLVTLDKLTLSENPDKVPTDPSTTDEPIAEVEGPWAIDLHQGGSLAGKGGGDERAVPLVSMTGKTAGGALDPTRRYAFGFDVVKASATAMNVNLDAAALADYQDMISKGYSVLYVGTATFKGGASCTSPSSTYEFSKLPRVVHFRLGFKSPATYVNCQNPDNDPATAFGGEEHQRGIQVKDNTFVVAQVTVHTDHPFWESVLHDSPAHFDMIAARHWGADTADAVLEDLIGVDVTKITDSRGVAVPFRSCTPSYTPRSGAMSFDPQSIPVDPSKPPSQAFRDLYDFSTYNQSTQGHLNSDGLCYVRRHYPAP